MIKDFMKERGWVQLELVDQVNFVLSKHPELKKITNKNPDGLTEQQTIQRLITGQTKLDERWLRILGLVFDKTPNELLGIKPKSDDWLQEQTEWLKTLNEEGRQAFEDLKALQDKYLKKD